LKASRSYRLHATGSCPSDASFVNATDPSHETPAWDSHGFTIFEDRVDDGDPFVHVETLTAGLNITEPTDVQAYRQMFDRLRELALDREDAKGLLAELMDELSQ
jgi:hypothetical protein